MPNQNLPIKAIVKTSREEQDLDTLTRRLDVISTGANSDEKAYAVELYKNKRIEWVNPKARWYEQRETEGQRKLPQEQRKRKTNLNYYAFDEHDFTELNMKANNIYLQKSQEARNDSERKFQTELDDMVRNYNFNYFAENEIYKASYAPYIKAIKVSVNTAQTELMQLLQEKGSLDNDDIFHFWLEKRNKVGAKMTAFFELPHARSIFNYNFGIQFAYNLAQYGQEPKTVDDFVTLAQYCNTILNREDGIANFRTSRAIVVGKEWTAVPDDKINDMMNGIGEWFINSTGLHPIEKVSILHSEIVRTQAFSDGNHRTARLISNYYLMSQGLPPMHIRNDSERALYEQVTDKAIKTHDVDDMIDFCYASSLRLASKIDEKIEEHTNGRDLG